MEDMEKKIKLQIQALRLKKLQQGLEDKELDIREIEEEAKEATKEEIIELLLDNITYPIYTTSDLQIIIEKIRRI